MTKLTFKEAELIFTEEDLNTMCKDYQKTFGLQDWNIQVKLVDQALIEESDAQAKIIDHLKQAHILIPTPETWSPHPMLEKQNMRLSLIHELIHVIFAYADPQYKRESLKDRLWESAIDTLAKGISSLLEITDLTTKIVQHAQAKVASDGSENNDGTGTERVVQEVSEDA